MCSARRPAKPTGPDQRGQTEDAAALRVLAVGDLVPASVPMGETVEVILARFEEVDATSLAAWRPALVLAPLVGAGFDGFDLAERLTGAGYTGRFRAVVEALPNPAVVRREFAAQFPGLDFDVLVLGGPT